jgi:hypothetical protein
LPYPTRPNYSSLRCFPHFFSEKTPHFLLFSPGPVYPWLLPSKPNKTHLMKQKHEMYRHFPIEFCQQPDNEVRSDIQIENDIMRRKLQSEANAIIGIKKDIPPELENIFLRNVLAIEEAGKNIRMTNLYDFLGKPEYKNIAVLQPDEVTIELERLKNLFTDKQVIIDVLDTYDDATIYKFITEELFQQQTYEDIVPGMVRHFVYEEFHPNHKLDIRERAMDFLGDWFERKLDEY